MFRYLDLDLLAGRNLLLLGSVLVLVLMVIREVDLDAECIADPVHTSPMSTHNTSDKLPADLEFSRLCEYGMGSEAISQKI